MKKERRMSDGDIVEMYNIYGSLRHAHCAVCLSAFSFFLNSSSVCSLSKGECAPGSRVSSHGFGYVSDARDGRTDETRRERINARGKEPLSGHSSSQSIYPVYPVTEAKMKK